MATERRKRIPAPVNRPSTARRPVGGQRRAGSGSAPRRHRLQPQRGPPEKQNRGNWPTMNTKLKGSARGVVAAVCPPMWMCVSALWGSGRSSDFFEINCCESATLVLQGMPFTFRLSTGIQTRLSLTLKAPLSVFKPQFPKDLGCYVRPCDALTARQWTCLVSKLRNASLECSPGERVHWSEVTVS